ncbi:hypothetical protein [Bradyrhizobium liaoningense]
MSVLALAPRRLAGSSLLLALLLLQAGLRDQSGAAACRTPHIARHPRRRWLCNLAGIRRGNERHEIAMPDRNLSCQTISGMVPLAALPCPPELTARASRRDRSGATRRL